MAFFSKLLSPWCPRTKEDYTLMNWISDYPVTEVQDMRHAGLDKIKGYASFMMRDLNRVQMTAADLEGIISHLVDIAKISCLVKHAIMGKLSHLNTEKNFT